MADGFFSKLKKAFNVFTSRDPTYEYIGGPSYSYRPDRFVPTGGSDRSIVLSIFNRMAMDVASIDFRHAKLDENGRLLEELDSGLNNCLTTEANVDQTARGFIQDIVMSMMDEGVVAIVPIDTDINPESSMSIDILTMRTGRIVTWYPEDVTVEVYNQGTGNKQQITLPKRRVGIIENPLYGVINEPNGTMQRLIRKLALLDVSDSKNATNRLDLIVQLPYIIKSDARKAQAEQRRADIEEQLTNSKYGVAYTDGTEKITQLNRPVENQLLEQVKMLKQELYAELGLTEEILNGTATEQAMLNYYDRTIEPICLAIADEMKRKFLTKTARTQRQSIVFFRDPFKLVPVSSLAEIADSFTRNEVMTSNEVRQILGLKPSPEPNADELRNKNLYPEEMAYDPYQEEIPLTEEQIQNG